MVVIEQIRGILAASESRARGRVTQSLIGRLEEQTRRQREKDLVSLIDLNIAQVGACDLSGAKASWEWIVRMFEEIDVGKEDASINEGGEGFLPRRPRGSADGDQETDLLKLLK